MRKTVKKYRDVQAKYRAVQATGRRTVAARQLKRLQPAQKLEERNPSLIASGNFPNTVLLFELRCACPALRVTENIEIIEK